MVQFLQVNIFLALDSYTEMCVAKYIVLYTTVFNINTPGRSIGSFAEILLFEDLRHYGFLTS